MAPRGSADLNAALDEALYSLWCWLHISSQIDISAHIPNASLLSRTANAISKLEKITFVRWRVFQDTRTVNHQVIEERENRFVAFQSSRTVNARQFTNRACRPRLRLWQPATGSVVIFRNMT